MKKRILKTSLLLTVLTFLLSSCVSYPHYHVFNLSYSRDNNHHWLDSTCDHKIGYNYGLHYYDTEPNIEYIEEVTDETKTITGRVYCQTCHDFIDKAEITEIYDERLTFRKVNTLEDNSPFHKENEPRIDSYSVASHVRKEDYVTVFGEMTVNNDYGDFIIPDTYQGLPVNLIAPNSFEKKHFSSITFGKNIEGIGDSAFVGSTFDCDLVIPNTIKYIDLQAFLGTNLKKVTLGESITEIRGATFSNCQELEEIVLNDNIWTIDYFAFAGCHKLKSLTFPKGLSRFYPTAFAECFALKDIIVPKENKFFTHDGEAILSKNKRVLYMPIKITNDEYTVPNSVTSIANCAFRMIGDKVKKVNLNKNLRYIDTLGLSGLWYVEELKIPNRVTEIKDRAFANSALKKLTLPKSIKKMEADAFYDCWDLTSIDYQGTLADWDKIDKSSAVFNGSQVIKVNCKDGTLFVK